VTVKVFRCQQSNVYVTSGGSVTIVIGNVLEMTRFASIEATEQFFSDLEAGKWAELRDGKFSLRVHNGLISFSLPDVRFADVIRSVDEVDTDKPVF